MTDDRISLTVNPNPSLTGAQAVTDAIRLARAKVAGESTDPSLAAWGYSVTLTEQCFMSGQRVAWIAEVEATR